MDFEETDEDLRLAIRLSEIESQFLPPKTRMEKENEDFEFAESELTLPSDTANSHSDFLLAKQLAQDDYHSTSTRDFNSKKSKTLEFNFAADIVDEDYMLAVKLVEEDWRDSSRGMKKVLIEDGLSNDTMDSDYELACRLAEEESASSSKYSGRQNSASVIENGFLNDIMDSDYELALRLADEELATSSKYLSGQNSVSAVELAKKGISEPAFNSEIHGQDLLLAGKLFETNDSDVEIIDEPQATDTAKVNSGRDKNKNSPSKMNSSNYMNKTMSVVDPAWETIDPNPDIHALFIAFNKRFFWSRLDMIEVKWSPRMTLCAGICSYQKRAGHCVVKLSKPLLTYRPRKDLVETLLHEMIHAYLFVTNNDKDRDGHGFHFHQHMYRINRESGANITVYHSFHNEVRMYKTHAWKCDGPCQRKEPYYGLVRRSMNRAPGPNDIWWAQHLATCGGKFYKIEEPESYKKKKSAAMKTENGKKPRIPASKLLTNAAATSSFSSLNSSKTSLSSTNGSNEPIFGFMPITKSNGTKESALLFRSLTNDTSSANSTARVLVEGNSIPAFDRANIVTLADLSRNMNKKRSPTKSPTKSSKKWAPLPGQINILSFIQKS